ncbi:hypothetical protein G6F63_016908 [Rhizopus arrhizus]|nr:hypothetical protein G6F63_016908 [Rhizopus arrhizus]
MGIGGRLMGHPPIIEVAPGLRRPAADWTARTPTVTIAASFKSASQDLHEKDPSACPAERPGRRRRCRRRDRGRQGRGPPPGQAGLHL